MNEHVDVATAYDRLIGGEEAGSLLIAGPPCSGKTRFAYAALLRGIRRFGDAHAMMTVSGRVMADELGNKVIREVGASSLARPVTTLSAVAFRVIDDARSVAGEPAPRLLNGAEQDALLRRVVGVHLQHAESGDMCDTCMLLRDYFASEDWADTVVSGGMESTGGGRTALSLFERGISSAFIDQLRDMLARINELGASFRHENELIAALSESDRPTERTEVQWRLVFALRREYVSAIESSYPGEYRLDSSRLLVEAETVVRKGYRSLPSVLVVDDFQDTTLAGMRFLEALSAAGVRLLLVGDPDEAVQIFRGSYPEYLFTRARDGSLHADMLRLDESWSEKWAEAEQHYVTHQEPTYRDVVASRISLSIPSPEDEDRPLLRRFWKLPHYEGSQPIRRLPEDSPLPHDGTARTVLYRSAREELDDVTWRIKRMHLDTHTEWNDMAIIAHDNATVRSFGERLRRDGVPVRYSSVNRPLKEEPFVQGLFALTELAVLRRQGVAGTAMSLSSTAAYVRTRVKTLLGSSLITTGSRPGEGNLVRWEPIESAMTALASLSKIILENRQPGASGVVSASDVAGASGVSDGFDISDTSGISDAPDNSGTSDISEVSDDPDAFSVSDVSVSHVPDASVLDADSLSEAEGHSKADNANAGSNSAQTKTSEAPNRVERLVDAWERLRQAAMRAHSESADSMHASSKDNSSDGANDATVIRSADVDKPTITVDDRLVDDKAAVGDDLPFGVDALYVMLAFNDNQAPVDDVLSAIAAVLGNDPQSRAFARLWELVDNVATGLNSLDSEEPQYVLSLAWNATGVAKPWQSMALRNTPEGRATNDRLDVAMRLFRFAEESGSGRDITSFIAQVKSMQIEADSLAHVGPVEQAVTLTTPAGAAGRHWKHVWIPALQQDIWPNLAERSTLFGGEDLADMMLRGMSTRNNTPSRHDQRLMSVLSSEKKSLLVAVTRAEESVTFSAAWNDDLTPSDFLYAYLPEQCTRNKQNAHFNHAGSELPGDTGDVTSGTDGASEEKSAELQSERVTDEDGYAGLDADPRGLVTAARVVLARHDPQSPQGRDAVATLATLAKHGVAYADPDNWAFPGKDTEMAVLGEAAETTETTETTETLNDANAVEAVERRSSDDLSTSAGCTSDSSVSDGFVSGSPVRREESATDQSPSVPVVTLSPSAVDGIWGCPVCWMLENRLSGPRVGSVATSFGTVIHKVAQMGSEEGLDRKDFMPDATEQERINAVKERLLALYETFRTDPSTITDSKQRYQTVRKDATAEQVLEHIASYFVTGGSDGYLGGNAKNFHIGILEQVECEREFTARFDMDDIVHAYNALPHIEPVSRGELSAIMGYLVGGWPEGMRDDLVIRLSGRIDRLEHRRQADGSETIRLIDYKTGKSVSVLQMGSDLQLVCYQLGLAFPDGGNHTVSTHSQTMPRIAQSELFYVADKNAPAYSYAPEGVFQPPLFIDGSLNAETFTPRSHYGDMTQILDVPSLQQTPPDGVGAQVWKSFLALRGTQAVWALTMIARVFYAGAVSVSHTLTAHPTAAHLKYCTMRGTCPACAGRIDTIYETRQA